MKVGFVELWSRVPPLQNCCIVGNGAHTTWRFCLSMQLYGLDMHDLLVRFILQYRAIKLWKLNSIYHCDKTLWLTRKSRGWLNIVLIALQRVKIWTYGPAFTSAFHDYSGHLVNDMEHFLWYSNDQPRGIANVTEVLLLLSNMDMDTNSK